MVQHLIEKAGLQKVITVGSHVALKFNDGTVVEGALKHYTEEVTVIGLILPEKWQENEDFREQVQSMGSDVPFLSIFSNENIHSISLYRKIHELPKN